ncbi:MAG: carbamoyltransferase HypF, partial [Roseiflexaceae bacterium]|nr:carbamoyltransferase HypF [Roseiflexaceae bacterium]
IAYDLHPGYLATQEAQAAEIVLKIGVQHHHAHIASVIIEHGLEQELNGLDRRVIGIAADGTGYGLDGAIWGCELLIADLADFERAGHLAYIPLPGGDQAIRQPWRVAATYLAQAYGPGFIDIGIPFTQQLDRARWNVLAQMIARNLNSPPTSSLGRLFDAIAALIGLRNEVLYEGQAAIELEVLAKREAQPYPFKLTNETPFQIEVGPMIEAIVDDLRYVVDPGIIAGRFHATVAAFLVAACQRIRAASGIERVALSGGVFQNRLLLENLTSLLAQDGFRVYAQRRVPTNDGGLSLGQAAVASERIARGRF